MERVEIFILKKTSEFNYSLLVKGMSLIMTVNNQDGECSVSLFDFLTRKCTAYISKLNHIVKFHLIIHNTPSLLFPSLIFSLIMNLYSSSLL